MSMGQAIAESKSVTLSWAAYAAALARDGVRTVAGTGNSFWMSYQRGAMMRVPPVVGAPDDDELARVFWRGRAAIASYLLSPSDRHPPNAFLYICRDHHYSLERLAPPMRRNVRRATAALRIAPLSGEVLLAHGATAFCDTRRRLGLSDGTPAEFARRFGRRARNPAHVTLGAWKDDALAAFLSLTEVEDYAEVEGSFAADAFRAYRPSDALQYTALRHYLVERDVREVSSGLSSIQADSNALGLHRFKCKVGFVAEPVHRAFVPHPLLRPLVRRTTLSLVAAALRARPGDPALKKLAGMLACMLGDVPEIAVVNAEANQA
jgi:hypothetical protein